LQPAVGQQYSETNTNAHLLLPHEVFQNAKRVFTYYFQKHLFFRNSGVNDTGKSGNIYKLLKSNIYYLLEKENVGEKIIINNLITF